MLIFALPEITVEPEGRFSQGLSADFSDNIEAVPPELSTSLRSFPYAWPHKINGYRAKKVITKHYEKKGFIYSRKNHRMGNMTNPGSSVFVPC
jgi:hypothetical protein